MRYPPATPPSISFTFPLVQPAVEEEPPSRIPAANTPMIYPPATPPSVPFTYPSLSQLLRRWKPQLLRFKPVNLLQVTLLRRESHPLPKLRLLTRPSLLYPFHLLIRVSRWLRNVRKRHSLLFDCQCHCHLPLQSYRFDSRTSVSQLHQTVEDRLKQYLHHRNITTLL
jgi:hypothetical protein